MKSFVSEKHTHDLDCIDFQWIMSVLKKIIEIHNNCLFEDWSEFLDIFNLCPKISQSFTMIFIVCRTEISEVLLFDLFVPIFIKIICYIFMQSVQSMYVEL